MLLTLTPDIGNRRTLSLSRECGFYGALCRYSVAIMLDTEGSEVHISAVAKPRRAEVTDDCCTRLYSRRNAAENKT